MKLIVSNAFSLNMLPEGFSGTLEINSIKIDVAGNVIKTFSEVYNREDCINAIGHQSTDAIVRGLLNEIDVSLKEGTRMTIKLDKKDILLVCQYKGERLPEGATELPEGSMLEWMLVKMK